MTSSRKTSRPKPRPKIALKTRSNNMQLLTAKKLSEISGEDPERPPLARVVCIELLEWSFYLFIVYVLVRVIIGWGESLVATVNELFAGIDIGVIENVIVQLV